MALVGFGLLMLSRDYARRATELQRDQGDPDGFWRNTGHVHRLFIQPAAIGLIGVGAIVFLVRGVASL